MKTKTSALLVPLCVFLLLLAGCSDLFPGGGGPPAQAPAFVDLPGDSLFPEGILAATNGDLYVSGFGNGSVVRVSEGTRGSFQARYFKTPGEDGLSSAVGMALDEARGRLWVANFSFETFSSTLKVFDVESGALLATLAHADDGRPHFFNEIALDAQGRVYVTDTAAPVIWTAGPALDTVEVFVEDAALANPDPERPFGLNGLALTPDSRHLIASVMDRIDPGGGRLVRIGVASRAVAEVALSGATETLSGFGGSDGMIFLDAVPPEDALLVMVNVTPTGTAPAIMTAAFSDDFASAELVGRPRFDAAYNRPTASAVRDGRLWTVNSQLDHLIDDENGALGTPPDLPFQLVGVSLDETLDR